MILSLDAVVQIVTEGRGHSFAVGTFLHRSESTNPFKESSLQSCVVRTTKSSEPRKVAPKTHISYILIAQQSNMKLEYMV